MLRNKVSFWWCKFKYFPKINRIQTTWCLKLSIRGNAKHLGPDRACSSQIGWLNITFLHSLWLIITPGALLYVQSQKSRALGWLPALLVFGCADKSLRQLYTFPCPWVPGVPFTFWHQRATLVHWFFLWSLYRVFFFSLGLPYKKLSMENRG